MNPRAAQQARETSLRLGAGLLALVMLGVIVVYASRIFLDLPLYPAAEGGYLIQALYGKTLSGHPALLPDVQGLNNTAFFLIIRATTYLTQDLLVWLRVLGACAYFAGLLLVYRSLRTADGHSPPLGFLLLALAFPYYRFVFAALPDGWFLGVLGLLVFATARIYLSRPILHAIAAGALCAVLVLLKPQGLAIAVAVLILALLDVMLGRRDIRVFIGRVAVFATTFLAAGNLILLMAGQPIVSPFAFLFSGPELATMGERVTTKAFTATARSLAPLLSAFLLLAGVPALTGLLRIEMRWRWITARKLGPFRLERQEIAFLFVLVSLIITLAMTAVVGLNEPHRILGRDFEVFAPILWLTAAPFIAEFDRDGARWWRTAMGLVVAVGVASLAICLFSGAIALPWDTAALNAFFLPDLSRLDLAPALPHFALASAAILAAGGAMAVAAWPIQRIWLTAFVVLAALSTLVDVAWENSLRPARATLGAELRQADLIVAQRLGGVAVLTQDKSMAHQVFLALRGRPQTVLIGPDAARPAGRLADADTVVAVGVHPPLNNWRPVFQGKALQVFERASPPHLHARDGEPLGSDAGSG